jgi:hypothetical protein
VTSNNGSVSVGDRFIDVDGFFTDIIDDFGVVIITGREGFNGADVAAVDVT